MIDPKTLMARARLATGLAACLMTACASPEADGVLRVGVAGNFAGPAREIAARFEQSTGHRVELSFGATGQLYAQIIHGAPFDVLMAADAERPRRLAGEGYAVAGSQFTYATGRLVALASPGFPPGTDISSAVSGWVTIAVANPATAPYGRAAVEVMTRLGLNGQVGDRIVTASGVAQAFQFVASGSVDGGFVAWSQARSLDAGRYVLVPESLHAPIRQDAVLLAAGETRSAALAWMRFLRTADIRAYIRSRGYELADPE